MNSGSHRGFTTVTIITFIFAPFLVGHHWRYGLVTVNTDTHVEQCATPHPCPAFKTIRIKLRPPLPPDPPRRSGDNDGEPSNSKRAPAGPRH